MRLLLDTHIFLWFIDGDRRLDPAWAAQIRDPDNPVFLSVVSIWEVLVKHRLGKLPLPEPPDVLLLEQRERHRISSLALDEASVVRLAALPLHHHDPLDRMLVCQALAYDLTLVTVDPAMRAYPVAIL